MTLIMRSNKVTKTIIMLLNVHLYMKLVENLFLYRLGNRRKRQKRGINLISLEDDDASIIQRSLNGTICFFFICFN